MLALADFDPRDPAFDSTNSLTYFNRAMLRTQIGDHNRALEDYDRVAPLLAEQRPGLLQPRRGTRPVGRSREAVKRLHLGHRVLYPDFCQRLHLPRTPARTPPGSQRGGATAKPPSGRLPNTVRAWSDSTYSIFADTTQRFRTACCRSTASSPEVPVTVSRATTAVTRRCACCRCSGFTLMRPDTLPEVRPYRLQRIEDFRKRIGNNTSPFRAARATSRPTRS